MAEVQLVSGLPLQATRVVQADLAEFSNHHLWCWCVVASRGEGSILMDASFLTAIGVCIAAAGPTIIAFLAYLETRKTHAQSRENRAAIADVGAKVSVVETKVTDVEVKIDGPLKALIASIRAEAEFKIAVADEKARQAFRRGQDQPRAPDPELTKAIATEVIRVATDATTPP